MVLQYFLNIDSKRQMQFINTDFLSQIVARFCNHSKLTNSFKQINELCHLELKYSKPQNIVETAKRINVRQISPQAAKEAESNKESISWAFGQFKIFIWVIIYQCLINELELKSINEDIISDVQKIFSSKSISFIRYEIKLLNSHKNVISQAWTHEELELFQDIMKAYIKDEAINWKCISYTLFTRSDCKFFRNLNHCREKWNNHLNPYVNKGDWTVQEDIRLFELIDEYGLKWSKISKCMDNTRTEHMVKNRYNRYFRLWKISKNTSISYIKSIFKNKIEKEFLKEKKFKKQQESIEPSVKIEEAEHYGSCEEFESNDATFKMQSEEKMNVEDKDIMIKDENGDEDYRLHLQDKKYSSTQNTNLKVQKVSLTNELGWNYYPFLNAYLPQLKNPPCYPFPY